MHTLLNQRKHRRARSGLTRQTEDPRKPVSLRSGAGRWTVRSATRASIREKKNIEASRSGSDIHPWKQSLPLG